MQNYWFNLLQCMSSIVHYLSINVNIVHSHFDTKLSVVLTF